MNALLIVSCFFVSLVNAEICFHSFEYQKCYLTPDNKYRNYFSAKQYCEDNNAELLQPSSRNELEWVRLNVQPYPWRWFWLGTKLAQNKAFPTQFLNNSTIEFPFLEHNASDARISSLVTTESPAAIAGTWSSNKPWFLQNAWQPEITICERKLSISGINDEMYVKQLEAKDVEYNRLRKQIGEQKHASKQEIRSKVADLLVELKKSANITGYYQGRFDNEHEWAHDCQVKLEAQRDTCEVKILELEKLVSTLTAIDKEKHIDFVGSH